jgi:hypothetical protein
VSNSKPTIIKIMPYHTIGFPERFDFSVMCVNKC